MLTYLLSLRDKRVLELSIRIFFMYAQLKQHSLMPYSSKVSKTVICLSKNTPSIRSKYTSCTVLVQTTSGWTYDIQYLTSSL